MLEVEQCEPDEALVKTLASEASGEAMPEAFCHGNIEGCGYPHLPGLRTGEYQAAKF